jgi:hypothetical protein
VFATTRTALSAFRGIGMPVRLQYEIRVAPSASAHSMKTRVKVKSPVHLDGACKADRTARLAATDQMPAQTAASIQAQICTSA